MKYPEQALMYLSVEIVTYDDWSLLDMRIHDITLVADLTAHDPNDPYPCDGTIQGVVDNIPNSYQSSPESIADLFFQNIFSEWVLLQCWPNLKVWASFIMDVVVDFMVYIDILGNYNIQTMDIHALAFEGVSDQELESHAFNIGQLAKDFGTLLLLVALEEGLSYMLDVLRKGSCDLSKVIIGLAIWFVLFLGYLAYLDYVYAEGYQMGWEIVFALILLLWHISDGGIFKLGIVNSFRVLSSLIVDPVFFVALTCFGLMDELDTMFEARLNGWAFFIVEILAFIICSLYLVKYVQLAILEYME